MRLLVVVALVAACHRPHVNPTDLEQVAYRVVSEDRTPLAYAVLPPAKTGVPRIVRLYDLDGYRIFPATDGSYVEEYWRVDLMHAERRKRTTVVATEFMVEDLQTCKRAHGHVEEREKLPTLHDIFCADEIEAARETERLAARRKEYKRSCDQTLRKALRLAKRGDLAYIPRPFRAEIKRAIDSDDYYELSRALNAMIAVGIVAPANEHERERWRGNLDEPWASLALRTEEAVVRHKQAGGKTLPLARPPLRP